MNVVSFDHNKLLHLLVVKMYPVLTTWEQMVKLGNNDPDNILSIVDTFLYL